MCTPLEPLVFTAPARPSVRQRLADQVGGRDDQREAVALGRVDVEHQVGGPVRVRRR